MSGSGGGAEALLEIRRASVVAEDGSRLLDRIDLRVEPGEHTAILGPNGSGKSSLIRLIAHDHYPYTGEGEQGTVRVLGRERWLIWELRQRLGIVSADAHRLFPVEFRTVRGEQAVLSGLLSSFDVWDHHEVTPAMRDRAREAMEWMGVAHLAERAVTTLSTGELRRLLIARALAPDPDALLLDEPTSGLDLVTRRHFLDSLRQLAARGRTLILVTHRIEEVLPEVRRVVLLRGGRVLAEGSKEEMLTDERLSDGFGGAVRVRRGAGGYYSADVR